MPLVEMFAQEGMDQQKIL